MNELAVLFMLEIFDLQACLVKYCRAANNKTVCVFVYVFSKNRWYRLVIAVIRATLVVVCLIYMTINDISFHN